MTSRFVDWQSTQLVDLVNAVAGLLDAIAWPAAVLLLAYLFRDSLSGLVSDLRELRYKGLGARFGDRLEELEARASKAGLQEVVPEQEERSDINQLAAISPRAAIFEAWRQVEIALRDMAQSRGLREGLPTIQILNELSSESALPESTEALLTDLRVLRNEAVHEADADIDVSEALEFARLANRLEDFLTAQQEAEQ